MGLIPIAVIAATNIDFQNYFNSFPVISMLFFMPSQVVVVAFPFMYYGSPALERGLLPKEKRRLEFLINEHRSLVAKGVSYRMPKAANMNTLVSKKRKSFAKFQNFGVHLSVNV